MIIKKYLNFMKESSTYKFGCIMIEVPITNWNEIVSMIDPEDIYDGKGDSTYGIQENPHLTLLYGLHDNVTEESVKEVFEGLSDKINIEIHGIGIFENDEFDVVKFNVVTDGTLQLLHDKLKELPNSEQYKEYRPHITLFYTKKGTGKKYIRPDYKYKVKIANKVCYSMVSGKKVYFDI